MFDQEKPEILTERPSGTLAESLGNVGLVGGQVRKRNQEGVKIMS